MVLHNSGQIAAIGLFLNRSGKNIVLIVQEGIKVNNELKTDQSSDALDADFEPGKEFGFDATLDLAKEPEQASENIEEKDEIETQPQPLEAGV